MNCHYVIAVNVAWEYMIRGVQLQPLIWHNSHREERLGIVMIETGCDRSTAKLLFLAIMYCGNEHAWASEFDLKVTLRVSEIVAPLRDTLNLIRDAAINAVLRDGEGFGPGACAQRNALLQPHHAGV